MTQPLPDPAQISDAHLRRVTTALGVGAIASILDSTVVNVGMDHLCQVFHATLTQTQWIITAFLLAMTAVVPLSGWLMDRLGPKRAWLVALWSFLLGSVACGCAWNLDSLIVFRTFQGIGAGLILPALMTLLTLTAGKHRLMTAMTSFSLIAQIGPVLGPLLGGVILHTTTWRWLFLVNIPFCIIGIISAMRVVPETTASPQPRKLDLFGLVLLAPALTLAVYGLDRISPSSHASSWHVWVPLGAAAALAGMFVTWSLHRGRDSVIDVRLFRDRGFLAGSILTIMAGFTMFGGLLLLPLYYVQIRHETILRAAFWLVPQGVGAAALILFGKPVTSKLAPKARIALGFALIAVGTIPFALPHVRAHDAALIAAMFIRGLGIGASNPAINAAALAGLAPADVPAGTTAFNVVQRIGAPTGTTVIAVVLAHALSRQTPGAAFSTAFWVTAAAAALPVLVAFALPTSQHAPANPAPKRAASDPAPRHARES